MFFLGALHSITQLPLDLYAKGISNCKEGLSVPLSNGVTNQFSVKYDRINNIPSVIAKNVKRQMPSIDDEFSNKFVDLIFNQIDVTKWEAPKSYVAIINGYESIKKKSICFIVKLTNEGKYAKLLGNGISLVIQTLDAPFEGTDSFFTYTAFDFTEFTISNVVTSIKEEHITRGMIEAVSKSYAPLYFGSTISIDPFLANPSIAYISKFVDNYAYVMDYIDANEAKKAVEEWLQTGSVDFDAIAKDVLKVCLATPTPVPEPTQEPVPEPEGEQKDPVVPKPEKGFKKHAKKIIDKLKPKHRKHNGHRHHFNRRY